MIHQDHAHAEVLVAALLMETVLSPPVEILELVYRTICVERSNYSKYQKYAKK